MQPAANSSQTFVREISDTPLDALDISALIKAGQPVILRQAFQDKALVQAGQHSAQSAMDHIQKFYGERKLTTFIAKPEYRGRFFYNADATALDFDITQMPLTQFLDELVATNSTAQPLAYYAGSTDLKTYFPGMIEEDKLAIHNDAFTDIEPLASIWIGNRTIAAAHFDMSNNIAACMVGRRRFTLFPPDQIANLYPGPLFPTPAGQIVSMVDFETPDPDKHPDFAKALDAAQIAELSPGDVLIYPAMWWHQVEALDTFNILINYWWNDAASFLELPMNTLMHGLLSLRQRPEHERQAWRELFDYYLFDDHANATAHLDPKAQNILSDLDENAARRLRMTLINKLNR